MARLVFALAICAIGLAQQQQPKPAEPPEEDKTAAEDKEYAFNPLQASREITVGNFYFKKGSYRAAAMRFEEATKWDPTSGEAYLRLGDTYEKMGDKNRAQAAWEKFLEAAPDHKRANEIRRKMGKGKPSTNAKTALGSPVDL